jgi:hypothetical protein
MGQTQQINSKPYNFMNSEVQSIIENQLIKRSKVNSAEKRNQKNAFYQFRSDRLNLSY